MDFQLNPAVTLTSGTFSVLIAPEDMLVQALNSNLDLHRYELLFVAGNFSRILSSLDRRLSELDVRRGFTVFQLMTILEEAHHTLIFIEHDPTLYEDADAIVSHVAWAMREAAKYAMVILYSPGSDSFIDEIATKADRFYYFKEEVQYKLRRPAKGKHKGTPEFQTTLEVF